MQRGLLLGDLEHVITHNFLDLLKSHIVNVEFSQYLSSTFLVAEWLLEDVLDVGAKLGLEFKQALRGNSHDDLIEEANHIIDEGIVDFHKDIGIAMSVPGIDFEHFDICL